MIEASQAAVDFVLYAAGIAVMGIVAIAGYAIINIVREEE